MPSAQQIVPDETRYSHFELVRRFGPTLDERRDSSARLRKRQRLGRRLTWLTGRLDVQGLANIPASGPVILAVNHRSFMDGPVLFGLVDRPVSFLVKAEAFVPGARRILIDGAQIPVRRELLDPAPVRLALRVLDTGGVLGIFPEGTRGDGRVRQARPGVGYLAVRTGASVVPVAIHGSAELTRRRRWRRPAVTVTVAPALHFPRAASPLNRRHWVMATDEIRAVLADLVARTAPPGPRRSRPRQLHRSRVES